MGLPVAFGPRSKWGRRFFNIAVENASWSKDPSKKVGCVIVRPDKSVASYGYNGLPRGVPDTDEILLNKEFKLAATLHAEENAVLNAREFDLSGYTAYVYPMHVCCHCVAVLKQRGVKHLVCVDGPSTGWEQNKIFAKRLAELADMTLTTVTMDEFEKIANRPVTTVFKPRKAARFRERVKHARDTLCRYLRLGP